MTTGMEKTKFWLLYRFRRICQKNIQGNSPGALLARRAPTMTRWSLDARSKGQPGHSPVGGGRRKCKLPGVRFRCRSARSRENFIQPFQCLLAQHEAQNPDGSIQLLQRARTENRRGNGLLSQQPG